MTDPTIRVLAAAEYDFISIAAALDDLSARLDCCKDAPRALTAARQVRKLRGMLAHVLDALDADVTAAIAAAEKLAPAPF